MQRLLRLPARWEADRKIRRELRDKFDVAQLWRARYTPWALLAAIALGLVSWLVAWWLGSVDGRTVGTAAATTLTTGALLFAVLQWRAATSERALDKLYDRLDLANDRRLEACPDPVAKAKDLYTYYVFTEIDNVEYAIQKYELGFTTPAVTARVLRRFDHTCGRNARFRELVTDLIAEASYFDGTKAAIKKILERCCAADEAGPADVTGDGRRAAGQSRTLSDAAVHAVGVRGDAGELELDESGSNLPARTPRARD